MKNRKEKRARLYFTGRMNETRNNRNKVKVKFSRYIPFCAYLTFVCGYINIISHFTAISADLIYYSFKLLLGSIITV